MTTTCRQPCSSERREARLDLAAQSVAVVGGEIAAAVAKADVDQAAQGVRSADHAGARALDVQVEDDAGVGPSCPGEEAFAVLFDEAHRAVDDLEALAQRVAAHLGHECLERCAL